MKKNHWTVSRVLSSSTSVLTLRFWTRFTTSSLHTGRFFVASVANSEYTFEQTHSYNIFLELCDKLLQDFLSTYGATEQDFSAALLELKASSNPHWRSFDLLLQHVE